MSKPGRNDPCPCGSGKKYKRCCMMKARKTGKQAGDSHMGGVSRALDWLHAHYEEEITRWVDEEYADSLESDEVAYLGHLNSSDPEFNRFFSINMSEFLLADGRLRPGSRIVPVMELVLGEGGPLMIAGQRRYLEQLHARPLSLYEVQCANAGTGLWLKDMLKPRSEPIFVRERAASRQARVWDILGLRLMEIGDHWELSGAVYPLPREHALWLIETLRHERLPTRQPARKREIGHWIADAWMQTIATPPTMPQMRDAATGEAMVFITDHYRVNDWAALAARLAAEDDVEGDAKEGWNRLQSIKHDMNRSLVAINISDRKDRIELFTRSVAAADRQKAWFDGVAGDAVSCLTREISDPAALMQRQDGKLPMTGREMPVDMQHQIVHEYKQKHYANWADEPLPALNEKTPREAVRTADGRKAVVALLKDFENQEAQEAPFDFGFLWDALGLDRKQ